MLSDAKIKENIRPIEDVDAVFELKPVCFNFKDAKKKQYGFIAQDIECTKLNSIVFKNPSGIRSVNYSQIIPILVHHIQKLSKRVEHLENSTLKA